MNIANTHQLHLENYHCLYITSEHFLQSQMYIKNNSAICILDCCTNFRIVQDTWKRKCSAWIRLVISKILQNISKHEIAKSKLDKNAVIVMKIANTHQLHLENYRCLYTTSEHFLQSQKYIKNNSAICI